MGIGPPNLGPVVDSYSTPGTLRRFGPFTTNADGFRIKGPAVDTPTQGHIFPATGDIIARFELQDVAGVYAVHTTAVLRSAQPLLQLPADHWLAVVEGQLRELEVLGVGPWIGGPLGAVNYWEAALQEVVAS